MARWFDKYIPYLGNISKVPDFVFSEAAGKFKTLEGDGNIDVSIVVIAYNEEKYILPCIMSLSDMKTRYATEVIVVNNNSTDRTQEIIDRTGVRTVFQPKQGHGHARQAGLDIARGKYHLCADSDSLYPPAYVDTMVKHLNKKGVAAAYSVFGFYADGRNTQRALEIYEFFRDIIFRLRSIKRPELTVGGATLAFYTEQGRSVGWRPDLRRGEDGSMLLALKKYGRTVFVHDRKARIATSSRRLDADGSMFEVITLRLRKEMRRIHELFYKKTQYKDRDDNLQKP